jgi:hypothetical protein
VEGAEIIFIKTKKSVCIIEITVILHLSVNTHTHGSRQMIKRSTNRPLTETTPANIAGRSFANFADAQAYFEMQCRKYGKMAYCSTAEFAALKPILDGFRASEGIVYRRPRRVLRQICIHA